MPSPEADAIAAIAALIKRATDELNTKLADRQRMMEPALNVARTRVSAKLLNDVADVLATMPAGTDETVSVMALLAGARAVLGIECMRFLAQHPAAAGGHN
jgi:fructose-1,6-bisphosphatase/sedoheptulose 1,7-bisphosphatase-like protein